ncbi:MAG: alpha/beta fold hydrolase [Proteobacteria bacterium]|nr:alpha/beta fold hydrolase [Pseudomonadota bacterium]
MLWLIAILIVGVVLVFWLGATTSYDRDLKHTQLTAALPSFNERGTAQLVRIIVDGREFRARISGFDHPAPKGDLILLHGFPETSAMWSPLLEAAGAAGYRSVAFDQRGYSPGARPAAVSEYVVGNLGQDVLDVADAVGFKDFHLVGHDWGSGVGWHLVTARPQRLKSWTSLSIPHIAAFGAAISEDPDQRRKSSYMLLFRTPVVAEWLFAFNRFALMRKAMYNDHTQAQRDEYLQVMAEPGALTAALNWYRAPMSLQPDEQVSPDVDLPVLFIWGKNDPAVGSWAVEAQRQYMKGPFTEIELDTGHWIMETTPETAVAAIVRHLDSI